MNKTTQEPMEAKDEVRNLLEAKEPPAKVSVLQKFLSVRGLSAPDKFRAIPIKLSAESLSKVYTKRRHGQKSVFQGEAMRVPDDIFSESLDSYVPKKREQEFLNLHRDEEQVNEVFLTETRVLLFERQVLDKEVCDREENRNECEERLWQLVEKNRGRQGEEDEDQQLEQEKVAEEEEIEQQ